MTDITPSGGDDTNQIQKALIKGANLNFPSGNKYKVSGSLKLASNITWTATGAIFEMGSGGTITGTIDSISMTGGTYNGSAKRLIELVSTNSTYSNMTVNATGGHAFGLQDGSQGNNCQNIIANTSALADKGTGSGNTWTDCSVDENGSSHGVDGFIIKCKNSTFTRCTVKNCLTAGFGCYAKLDTGNVGIEISGNKFFDCLTQNNGHSGFSLNPSNFGGKIHDNFIQIVSTGNKVGAPGSTGPGSSGGLDLIQTTGIYNNTFDALLYNNPGGGLHIGVGPSNNSGNVVAYGNTTNDIKVETSGNTVKAFHPTDQSALKTSGSGISVADFDCQNQPTNPPFCVSKYCGTTPPSNLSVSLQINPSSISINQNTILTATVTGGKGPYSYQWLNLPTPCTGSNTNMISCTPNQKGKFDINVIVSDSSTPPNTASATGILTVDIITPVITPAMILTAIQPFLVPANRVNPNNPLVTSQDNTGPIYIYQLPGTNPLVLVTQTSGAVDCDGQTTTQCNINTDPQYQNQTSFQQSDGNQLNAAQLPFYVLPLPGQYFDYTKWNISGGQLGLIMYQDKMNYGVFGDEDANKKHIGEISYAMANSLGINPDPSTGGTSTGVTFLVFTGSQNVVNPIEDHNKAATMGDTALNTMLSQLGNVPPPPSKTKFNIHTDKTKITVSASKTGKLTADEACKQTCDYLNTL